MNILLLGAGGREHAFAWKLTQSPRCSQLFIAPGNPGTAQHGTNLPIGVNDFEGIKKACEENRISLVVVGPEDPLVAGLWDYLQQELPEVKVIGPSAAGAQLEGSKAFAKAFMGRHGIPTAAYREFGAADYEAAAAYVGAHPLPVVLKADGLAAGKGVIIAHTRAEASEALREMLQEGKFGAAGATVVVEEFLTGIEMSVFALTNGHSYALLPSAKDYKRIGEGDTGLNTGGMGAVSPVPFADDAFMQKVISKVVEPTIRGIAAEGFAYTGFVFIGIIKVGNEPLVIEYNCRMGDPETEVVLPRLQNDLVDLLEMATHGDLSSVVIEHHPQAVATVVAVSGGYPGDFAKGLPFTLPEAVGESLLFQAGTVRREDTLLTAGGRVLCVTSFGDTVGEAARKSKAVLEEVKFEGKYYRKDIGWEFSE